MTTVFTIPNDLVGLYPVQDMIEEALQEFPYSDHDIFTIKIAVEEALVNAIRHGNQMDPDKWVHIAFAVTTERFDIQIADEGEGFDYEFEFAPPDATTPHILARPCGRGILLMRAFMTEVRYLYRGNVVTMSKVREAVA